MADQAPVWNSGSLTRSSSRSSRPREDGKGTGLGLSTVDGIVNQAGGFIYVSSEIGEGALFSIFLPRHHLLVEPQPEAEATNGAAGEAPAFAEAKPRADLTGNGIILLVEDDEGLRSLNARGLRSRGYSVIEASNGIEAMEALEQENGAVDLVVSEVAMPEMDGPTLLKAMRGRIRTARSSSFRAMLKTPSRRACRKTSNSRSCQSRSRSSQLVTAVKETMTPS